MPSSPDSLIDLLGRMAEVNMENMSVENLEKISRKSSQSFFKREIFFS